MLRVLGYAFRDNYNYAYAIEFLTIDAVPDVGC